MDVESCRFELVSNLTSRTAAAKTLSQKFANTFSRYRGSPISDYAGFDDAIGEAITRNETSY